MADTSVWKFIATKQIGLWVWGCCESTAEMMENRLICNSSVANDKQPRYRIYFVGDSAGWATCWLRSAGPVTWPAPMNPATLFSSCKLSQSHQSARNSTKIGRCFTKKKIPWKNSVLVTVRSNKVKRWGQMWPNRDNKHSDCEGSFINRVAFFFTEFSIYFVKLNQVNGGGMNRLTKNSI